ncbi:LodA/GoxA family CTQ-dependent oxidase [Pontimicrobium sp. MEBiC01747]
MKSLYNDKQREDGKKDRSLTPKDAKYYNTTCNCDDPIDCLEHMFCTMTQERRVVMEGQCPARRPVFLRTHGIIEGEINILENDKICNSYKHGIFKNPSKHPVYVRYSSDLADGRPDWKSTIGIGIKIFNIDSTEPAEKGKKAKKSDTADLLLQNVPNFFVDTASDMCNFTKASFEGWGNEWIQDNAPNTNQLLNDMAKPIRSVFDTSLWSVVPFKLGDGYCKYILRPGTSTFFEEPDINDPDFLAKDLAGRMAKGPATLDIYIQKRPTTKDGFSQTYIDEHFPLDKATVVWNEKEAVPVKVATIKMKKQNITKQEQEIYGDWLAFNIGRTAEENKPAKESSVAQARVRVYQTSANYRRKMNQQPVEEPTAPGKPEIKNPKCPFSGVNPQPKEEQPKALTQEQIDAITHVRIHPGIGIARVGNSTKDYYIGPEVSNPEPTKFGSTRDKTGAIKRQAARFRVYGYDKNGNVVAEVQQSENTQVEWSVHVANKKSAWYEFNAAMDIPATVSLTVPLRNPDVKGSDRAALAIDPGEKKIMGLNMNDSSYNLNGNFQGTPVMLGQLRTDSVGRLLFMPGFGVSASPQNKPVFNPLKPSTFNNPAGWYDDIADGPVRAKVTVGDKDFDADAAWVASAPPNYAPDIVGWRNMNDLMQNVYMASGMLALPTRVSFKKHVKPILTRLSELQWVNKGFLSMFGAGAPMNFNDKDLLKKLSTAPVSMKYPDPNGELRRTIYNSFRAKDVKSVEEGAWPWIYGDAFGYTNPDPTVAPSADTYLQLPAFYDYVLSAWVKGDFISDYDPTESTHQTFDKVNLQQQPNTLDEANMHFCIADAFHPGAELTWPMRNASMYRAPYRIRMRAAGKDDPTYGSTLTTEEVAAMNGPLYDQGPGDLTRWMAVPWQGDTAFCRSGYDMEYDPYLPTFWPARVPNQVLTRIDYRTLMDTSKTYEERIAAFQNRPSWLRQLPGANPVAEQMQYMIDHFGEMGIVEAMPSPNKDKGFEWMPDTLYVENLTPVKGAELDEAHKLFLENYGAMSDTDRALTEAGWFSEEQRNEFETIKRRGN